MEQKSAWSEADAKTLDSILNDLRQGAIPDDEDVNWLKNLKDRVQPQFTWKPSDSQIECLSDAIKHYNSLGYPATKLEELLDDLKKLKG